MLTKIGSLLILLVLPLVAHGQQSRPLSPPDRPPVPLTGADQQRVRDEELSKKSPVSAGAPSQSAPQIRIPMSALGRHVSSGNTIIDSLVHEAAAQNGLDPCLIFSVMRAESSFNRMAISPKGASGLMQLMPATAARFGVKNIFEPRENVFGGAKYLRWLLNRFGGDVRLALAGYNAGEGAVEVYGYRIPPFLETQNYVRTIYSRYSRIHGAPSLEPAETAVKVAIEQPKDERLKEKLPTYNQIIRLTSSTGDGRSGQ